jgi:peptide/nickel transport system substrate-binding protein
MCYNNSMTTETTTTRRDFISTGIAAGAGVFAALAAGEKANAAGTKKNLRIATMQQTRPASPFLVQDAGGAGILAMVGEWLIWQTVNGDLEPRIAESWKATNGGRSWVFKIRKGVKFHDGTDLTADDVVYTFKSHLNPSNISAQKGNFKNLFDENGIVKVDNYTVRFNLLSANANFPYTVASTSYGACIMKSGTDGGVNWTKTMMSAGPWIMVSHKENDRTVFKKNKNYWAGNNSSFDTVEHIQFASTEAATPQLLTGRIDAVINVSPTTATKLSKNKFSVQQIPSATSLHVHMRCDWGPFKDKRVRQAAALTLDRAGYIKGILKGVGGNIANDSVMDSYPTKDTSVPQREKNITKAKQLMKAAGVPNGFEVELSTWGRDDIKSLALYIKNSFAEIGIKVTLKIDGSDGGGLFFYTYEPGISIKGKVYEYDNNSWLASNLGISDWVGRGVPDQNLMREFRSTGDWNASHINSPKLDAAIDKYMSALTFEKKKAASKEIQKVMLDETPVIIVYNTNLLVVTRKDIANIKVNGISQIDVTNSKN